MKIKIVAIIISCFFLSCSSNKLQPVSTKEKVTLPKNDQFNAYWYSGKAELNSYELEQSRYGEIRNGEVVLVFVTEPFSLSKQVKLDYPQKAEKDKVSVMKLNHIRKFKTGIYDYSIMNSIFTPIDAQNHPNTLKLNTSIQEWCGHTFTQLNLEENSYHYKQLSYFESEGDTETTIAKGLLEDELFTRIRLNEGKLPLGEIDLIFSVLYSRSSHQKLQVAKAKISKTESDDVLKYKIEYANFNRIVTIDVQNKFPFKILSWTENNGDGLLTKAVLKKSIKEAYWSKKKVSDEAKRKELQLVW